jgi:putative ABC transport system ATP-binding protein
MITIRGVYKTYNLNKNNAYMALENINETIADGELVAIVGESGAGKSTLLHILACIDTYEKGTVEIDGYDIGGIKDKELSEIRNRVTGIILQDFALLEDYNVYDNTMIPLYFSRIKRSERKRRVEKSLKAVGMYEMASKDVNQLSGGQKQRVAIARAIVNSPRYLFADEPTGALDSNTAEEILNLFRELNNSGITVLIVTHNPLIAQRCDRIICLKDGKIDNAVLSEKKP